MESDPVVKTEEILDDENYASENQNFFRVLLFLLFAETLYLFAKRRQRHLFFYSFFERTLQIGKIPLLIFFARNWKLYFKWYFQRLGLA